MSNKETFSQKLSAFVALLPLLPLYALWPLVWIIFRASDAWLMRMEPSNKAGWLERTFPRLFPARKGEPSVVGRFQYFEKQDAKSE
jgi:hypothetical protein